MMKNYLIFIKNTDINKYILLIFMMFSLSAFSREKTNNPPYAPLFNTPEYISLEIASGFNEDVIANGNGATINSTTSDIDGTGYCFLEQGLVTSNGNAPTTYGLDPSGFYDLTNDYEGAIYQFADYDENNSLRLSSNSVMSGTLTLTNPGSFQNIYLLATSGSASSTIDVTVNFDDNTSETISSETVPDWYNNTNPPAVITGIGRVNRNDDGLQSPFGNPRIYHLSLALDTSNYSKTVESITITKTNTDGYLNVFAVSAQTAAACLAPTNLAVTDVTTNSANFTWDAGDAESSWEIAIQESGLEAPESGSEITEQEELFENLTPNTEYEIFVRSYCGTEGSYSFWSTFTFTTSCGVSDGLDEGFESSLNIPNCWSVISDGDSSYPWQATSISSHTGNNSVRIRSDWNSHDDYLISAPFTVNANESDQISFWARNSSNTSAQPFDLVVSTTGNQKADFTDVVAANINPGTTWQEYTYDLSNYIGDDIYIAFRNTSTSAYNYYYLYIDDIQTSGIPLCPAPTNLDAPVVSHNSAELSWDAEGATAWEIAVQPEGSGEPTSGEEVLSNNYELSIDPETIYEFYVRVNCDNAEGFSPWAGPYVFGEYAKMEPISGLTDDVIANGLGTPSSSTNNDIDGGDYVYMSEDHQYDTNSSPVGANGDGLPINGDLPKTDTPGLHYQMSPFNTPYEGNNSLRLGANGSSGTLTYENVHQAESLYIMATAGGGSAVMTGVITFEDGTTQNIGNTDVPDWYYNTNPPVIISGIGRVNLTSEDVDSDSSNPRIYQLQIDLLAENQTKSISEIYFEKVSGGGIVNIFGTSIKLSIPICSTPTNVTVTNITDTSAEVTWLPNGDETEWEVIYGEEGFDVTSEGTTVSDNDGDLGVTLTDLDPETPYDVYVVAICDEDLSSEVSLMQTFTTLQEPCETPTDITITNITDTTAEVTWTSNGDEMEWEVLYGEEGFNIATEGTIISDNDGVLGVTLTDLDPEIEYEVYVTAVCASNNSSEISASEVFTTLQEPCETPTDVTITNITDTSAEVTWTANENDLEWIVIYGITEFNPETEGTTFYDNDGELGVILSNLDPNETYDVYVVAVCAADNLSENSEAETFTTASLSIDDNQFSGFKFYPNPAENFVTVEANQVIDQVTIYNLLGQKVLSKTINQAEKQLNITSLEKGSYIMQVSINGNTKALKLIITN